jgi:tRNA threonylcarbamoyladenosine biosynthesis protein TsaE
MIEVREVGPEQAAEVVDVIRAGFGAREVLDPPSTAPAETVASVAEQLEQHGGLLAVSELGTVGAILFESDGALLALRRVSVHPDSQGRGVARALIRRAEKVAGARGIEGVSALARAELPRTVRFWEHLGYHVTDQDGVELTVTKVLPVKRELTSGDEARALGERLAGVLRAGDLVILSGDLGAGKTTFTQGIGAGLDVRGEVTSPTFVISRVHPASSGGPSLVHVDAYRLGGIAELDDLDLDTSLDDAVTVVEWGEDVAEGLAPTRLEVTITRARGDDDQPDLAREDHDPRTFRFVPVGTRWVGTGLRDALTGPLP